MGAILGRTTLGLRDGGYLFIPQFGPSSLTSAELEANLSKKGEGWEEAVMIIAPDRIDAELLIKTAAQSIVMMAHLP
jgi:hypothetical protein